jgi:hypothetical protein
MWTTALGSRPRGRARAWGMAAGVQAPASAAGPASVDAKLVPKYCLRLAKAASVTPSAVHKIFEHLRKLAIDALQQMQRFSLHGIATLRRQHYRATAASTRTIHGHKFKAQALPATWRVNCTVATVLARTALTAAPCAPTALTPGAQALCQKLAASIGEQDITSDLVGKVVVALQNLIIGDLRAAGIFVFDGLVCFIRTEVKARPAEYAYNARYAKVILHKAKGARRRVFGRVPWPIG